ncbi:MAG: hypothetical protein JJ971_00840 [Balneolaceae bacterium]|nr:hypothetical protein [Balneolaceae bacterium]MBO6544916.1 hypothetical protein [Balneolaceae bacterium]MBO6646312.1 hypothetical protein [Balneolaceae bacterium]
MNASNKQTKLLIISNVASWLVLVSFFVFGFSTENKNTFDILTAKRINIVNEDGTTVIAIANKQHIAPPVFNGTEYPLELADGRKYMAGMIFFNQEGDEMGGLIFNSFKLPDGRIAGVGHLSFDRYKDNQVINLEYKENVNGVSSGLTFYDRPADGSFPKSLDLSKEYFFSGSLSEKRKQEIKDTLATMKANKAFGLDRLFLGSQNEIPQLSMKDTFGNERIRLFIDSTNTAKLLFFDKDGIIVQEISPQQK